MIKAKQIEFSDLPEKLQSKLPKMLQPPRSFVSYYEAKGSYILVDREGFLNKNDVKLLAKIDSLIAIKQRDDGIAVLFKK